MTVNYHLSVRTSRPWTLFQLLFSWKASIWKAVLPELVVWLILYYILQFVYRFALGDEQKRTFEALVRFFTNRMSYLPLEFLLGYFVTIVYNRWTFLYQNICFIDNVGLMTAEYVRGHSEEARRIRRSIMRYCELGQILVFRDISLRVRRRFPTLDTVVAAGFMLEHEKEQFVQTIDHNDNPKYWIPFQWALELVNDARMKGLIEGEYYQKVVTDEIKTFRSGLEWLCNYDWTPVPLIYPTVVCLTVHFYFLVSVMSRQVILNSAGQDGKDPIDVYFPFMAVLELIFYMGWLKVAETILNPFGEDDDDFECNALIDRNITMGLKIVDNKNKCLAPELMKDAFWNDEFLKPLYSSETAYQRKHEYRGSVSAVRIPHDKGFIRMVPHKHDNHEFEEEFHRNLDRIKNVAVHDNDPRASRRTTMSLDFFNRRSHEKKQRSDSDSIISSHYFGRNSVFSASHPNILDAVHLSLSSESDKRDEETASTKHLI